MCGPRVRYASLERIRELTKQWFGDAFDVYLDSQAPAVLLLWRNGEEIRRLARDPVSRAAAFGNSSFVYTMTDIVPKLGKELIPK